MINPNRQRQTVRLWHVATLGVILILAAYLRLANLPENPGWYTDEGTHLDIAQNLLRGRVQYLAVNQSSLLFAKLPLFDALLAALLSITGGGIGTLRAFTGLLGVTSVGLLYCVVHRIQGEVLLALLSALMYSIYPTAVLYSRFGFSYNLLTPLVLLTFWGLWEYLNAAPHDGRRRGWLALVALAIGIGGVSDLWMFVLIAPLTLAVSTRDWRDLIWSLALALLPFGLYAAIMLIYVPQAFLPDLRFIFSRLSRLSPMAQLTTLALNYTILVSRDHWTVLTLVGLSLLRPARLLRLSLLLFLLPVFVLGRTAALYGLSAYYMIPLLPFVGLGTASAVKQGVPLIAQTIRSALLSVLNSWRGLSRHPLWQCLQGKFLVAGANLVLALLVATPFITSTLWTAKQVQGTLSTEIDPFLINPAHARQAAEFVNSRTTANDLVIASPSLAWLLHANRADLQMSVAITGSSTPDLPAGVPAERFAFDPHYTEAHLVIVDNFWRNWGVWNVTGASEMMARLKTWPLVLHVGEIEVCCNPTRGNQAP